MSDADKIKLIHQHLSQDKTTQVSTEFQQWLDSDQEHIILYQHIQKIWDAATTAKALDFDHNQAYLKHQSKLKQSQLKVDVSSSPKRLFRYVASLAALLILVLSCVFLFKMYHTEVISTEVTLLKELPDGTKVWLQQGSQLDLTDFSVGKRKVAIKGIAYFDVAHKNNVPFTIIAQDFEVNVVGTKFIVNTDHRRVFVKDGIVDVKTSKSTMRLIKNQKMTVSENGNLSIMNASFEGSKLWFNEELIFKNAPFDKVIQDLSLNFNVKIIIPERTTWATCTFTSGALKTNNLDQILEILKLTYDLEYTKQKDNSIKLTAVKCK
jgi:transmembrane sensor